MGAKDSGLAFLQEVLSRIPDDRRESVQSLLETTPELVESIGAGVLRQDEFSRQMDRLKTVEAEQNTWWTQHKELAEVGQKAKSAGFDPSKAAFSPGPSTPVLPDDVVRRDEATRAVQEQAGFALHLATLQGKHLHEFGEPLDFVELAKDPRVKEIGLMGVYEAIAAPKRAAKQQAEQDRIVNERVEAGVREKLKTVSHPGYPSSKPPAGSPLDALEPTPSGVGVDDLVDEYNRLVMTGPSQ